MKQISGHLVTSDGKTLYIQKKRKIYGIRDGAVSPVFRIQAPLWAGLLMGFRRCSRLFRLDIRAAAVAENKIYYAIRGNLLSYDLENRKHNTELTFRKGMSAPLGIAHIQDICGFDDQICLGEYFANPDREKVRIWSNSSGIWEVAYTFPPGSVRHIHGIVPDSYRNCVYILTGDSNNESGIWVAENNFKDVRILVGGNQQMRCCVLQPRKDAILYATDSEYETNRLYKMQLEGDRPISREILSEIDGSVIHGYVFDKEMLYFSTTVEPDKGGIHSNKVNVYALDADMRLFKILSDEKDRLDPKLFQYGFADIIKCDGKLYIGFTATKHYDGIIIMM